jgi:hypothetical protein
VDLPVVVIVAVVVVVVVVVAVVVVVPNMQVDGSANSTMRLQQE